MKRTILAFSLCLLPLGGCETIGKIAQAASGSVATVVPEAMNSAKKALTATHRLHMGAADFLAIAATTNLCHAICAIKAKDYLDRSEAALVAADKLVVLGDANGIADKIAAATDLIAASEALIGRN